MSLEDWSKQKEKVIKESSDPKIKILLSAASSGEKLHIRYAKPDGVVDDRWITPQKVFSKAGEAENYVEAYCHKENGQRTFMIKRITLLNGQEEKSGRERILAPKISPGSVACSVDYVELCGDFGNPIDGVEVTCSRCGHVTESYGSESDSIRRCLALMREECPEEESNWYVEE